MGDRRPYGRTDAAGREAGRGFLTAIGKGEREAALEGVLGMMRSGQHDNPLLLEALGSLLTDGLEEGDPSADAKQLAARAYLRAADMTPAQDAKAAYRERAARVLEMQVLVGGGRDAVTQAEADLRRELADADAWFA